jgi:hypothetical protein
VSSDEVARAYHDVLIPKAIEYSGGILDYFFRGRLEVGYHPAICNWRTISITNQTGQDLHGGAFTLYYDDEVDVRHPVTSFNIVFSPTTGALAPGAFMTATFTPPPVAVIKRYILVYKGTIGTIRGSPLDPVDTGIAVAWGVFSPVPLHARQWAVVPRHGTAPYSVDYLPQNDCRYNSDGSQRRFTRVELFRPGQNSSLLQVLEISPYDGTSTETMSSPDGDHQDYGALDPNIPPITVTTEDTPGEVVVSTTYQYESGDTRTATATFKQPRTLADCRNDAWDLYQQLTWLHDDSSFDIYPLLYGRFSVERKFAFDHDRNPIGTGMVSLFWVLGGVLDQWAADRYGYAYAEVDSVAPDEPDRVALVGMRSAPFPNSWSNWRRTTEWVDIFSAGPTGVTQTTHTPSQWPTYFEPAGALRAVGIIDQQP